MNKLSSRDKETICAVSTPNGSGGIAVIRISGPMAIKNARQIAPFLKASLDSHKAQVGHLVSISTNEKIDQAVATPFLNGNSFTGEEVLEISCHGSPAFFYWILEELLLAGCKLADKGEFTYRAFMNGKLDLVQAEAVLELIQSESKQATRQALNHLSGGLSKRLEKIEYELVGILAQIEASIDFSEEDLDISALPMLKEKLLGVLTNANDLLASYRAGSLLQNGLTLVLSGRPNVGKSSLLNLLVQDDRAIVSDIPGTTRDLVDASIFINGVRVRIVDTAGLRESVDQVEKIGMQKSKQAQETADLNLFVFDAASGISPEERELINGLDPSRLILVGNKLDQVAETPTLHLPHEVLWISCLRRSDRSLVLDRVEKFLQQFDLSGDGVLTKLRQFENLAEAQRFLQQGLDLIAQGAGTELVAFELREGLQFVQNVLGKRFDDDILDRVFSEFCIGK